MKRRELLKLGAAVPVVAIAHAQHTHGPVPDLHKLPAPPKDADWKPAFFDAHQNATVIVLSELIIPETDTPGAKAAQVNRYMDKILNESSKPRQRAITDGLAWLDRYANKQAKAAFVELTPEQQVGILEKLAGAPASDLQQGQRFFQQFKGETSRIYYATQIGTNELNKGGRVPKTFACLDAAH